ncbi:MAG: hypothetical protein GC189_06345 [Alphaproteobacteria bacterium]|nr:hypothetical protein [Alphaproteobacteria bacterium]
MRLSLVLTALMALAACAQPSPAPDAANANCDHVASSEIAFTSTAVTDTVVAHTLGPACAHAVGVLIIRAPDGAAIWSWSAPLYPTFGGLFAPVAGADVPAETIADFTRRWTQLAVSTTSDAPPWPEADETPLGGARPGLERAVYEDVRARDLPMTCHLSGVALETCVYWESAAAAAIRLVERPVRAAPDAADAPPQAPAAP